MKSVLKKVELEETILSKGLYINSKYVTHLPTLWSSDTFGLCDLFFSTFKFNR
jgi:hypothetical protein